ncbi:MAG: cyclic nucleotide-binding protein [Bacteroidetes bacterium]|nr:cyclic nucleotide-binding protein [Bacteroidota bacterium]
MNNSNQILKLLNIRRDESWLVSQLFFLQFFQGAGVALFFTVANALFLEKHEIHQLPKVYMLAAGMLLIAGFIYSKLEHALPVKKLIGAVIIFMAVSVGLFRLGIFVGLPDWSLYLMAAWYYILYLLSNLEFWGLSALLFDIRQSKRLFGIISAGDIPAKFIGYFSAYLVIPFIGSVDTLYISMVSIGLSLFFWYRLMRAGKLDIHVNHHHVAAHEPPTADISVTKLIQGFFGSNLILSVAALSFVVVTASTIINFTFYAEVKERMHEHSNANLAAFIGLFLSVGRLVAVFVKLLLTGKLADALGIKGSLLITPLVLLIAIFAVTLSPSLSEDSTIILYVFGIMAVLSETLKASIQDPVFIAVMQPLRTSLRLRGHTIVKGVMDPFALAFGSIIIFVVMGVTGNGVNMHAIGYLLIGLIAVWVALIFIVDQNYLTSLVEGLSNRYVNGRDIDLTKEETRKILSEKIPTAKAGEAIYLLQLAAKLPDSHKDDLLRKGLAHTDEKVQLEAIKIVEANKLQSLLPELQILISSHPSRQILAQGIQAVCTIKHEEDVEDFSPYLDNKDLNVVKASVIGLLKNGSINAVVSAGQKLQQLRDSAGEDERAIAAEVVGALRVKSFYPSLLTLLGDKSEKVMMAAIEASGRLQSEKLVKVFVEKLQTKKLERAILDALLESGQAAVKTISAFIMDANINKDLRLKLFHLIAKTGGAHAQNVLELCIDKYPECRAEIYAALHLCRFRVQESNKEKFDDLIEKDMSFSAHLLSQIAWIQRNHENQSIESALMLEFDQAKTRLLWLFSFTYEEEKIMRAKNGFQLNKKESIANAHEIIDMVVYREIASRFNTIFEQAPVPERLALLKATEQDQPADFDALAKEVLSGSEYIYNPWTKAVVMYSMTREDIAKSTSYVRPFLSSPELLLRETSEEILKKTATPA